MTTFNLANLDSLCVNLRSLTNQDISLSYNDFPRSTLIILLDGIEWLRQEVDAGNMTIGKLEEKIEELEENAREKNWGEDW